MSETLTLNNLQIKRLKLENEFAALIKKEKELEIDLKKREKAIIKELQNLIVDKKSIIEILKSKCTILERKLSEIKINPESKLSKEKPNKAEPNMSLEDDSEDLNLEFFVPGKKVQKVMF